MSIEWDGPAGIGMAVGWYDSNPFKPENDMNEEQLRVGGIDYFREVAALREHKAKLIAAAQQALDLLMLVPDSANDKVPIEKVRQDLRLAIGSGT